MKVKGGYSIEKALIPNGSETMFRMYLGSSGINVYKDPASNALVTISIGDACDSPVPNCPQKRFFSMEVAAGYAGANNWKAAAACFLNKNLGIPESSINFIGE